MQGDFSSNLSEIRKRARMHMESGAVTDSYKANLDVVIKFLNEALATEIVCVLRYKRHYFMAQGWQSEPIAAEFLEHAQEEQEHADTIAIRITQLGGKPDLNPQGLTSRSASEYVEGDTLLEMVREDLVAESIAIDTYKEMITYVGNDDPTTRRMLEEILAKEEEHADDLAQLLSTMNTDTRINEKRAS